VVERRRPCLQGWGGLSSTEPSPRRQTPILLPGSDTHCKEGDSDRADEDSDHLHAKHPDDERKADHDSSREGSSENDVLRSPDGTVARRNGRLISSIAPLARDGGPPALSSAEITNRRRCEAQERDQGPDGDAKNDDFHEPSLRFMTRPEKAMQPSADVGSSPSQTETGEPVLLNREAFSFFDLPECDVRFVEALQARSRTSREPARRQPAIRSKPRPAQSASPSLLPSLQLPEPVCAVRRRDASRVLNLAVAFTCFAGSREATYAGPERAAPCS
jgi:hypothetical protein